jgi:hypothetical protein
VKERKPAVAEADQRHLTKASITDIVAKVENDQGMSTINAAVYNYLNLSMKSAR